LSHPNLAQRTLEKRFMTLKIYNSYSGKKEIFTPLQPDTVKMYVCGPTVYNRVHIGNARPVVVFDTLFRLLKTLYGEVIYARNITDIDDKIMNAAKAGHETIADLSARYAKAYFEDMAALNNLQPTITPYATEHIHEMIAMVQTLIANGHAYAAQGHVLFDVKTMHDYGKLSRRPLDEMVTENRIDVATYKKFEGDFVLWKPSADTDPGWDSPWGRGRPGWHLECSAMIEKHLGTTIDIHGGGIDLKFPHHENELAQSTCAHGGKPFVKYWMHNAYINIDGEKMSKSLGNFRMVNDLLQHYPGEVIRFAILSAHYRSELNFSTELLDQAKKNLDAFYKAKASLRAIETDETISLENNEVYRALLDDLNTPIAISCMHRYLKTLQDASDKEKIGIKTLFMQGASLLGILEKDPQDWFYVEAKEGQLSDAEVDALVEQLQQARANKDYARADEIRAQLSEEGIVLAREGWKRG
jgi:cysteinyl-tRNA synthetase